MDHGWCVISPIWIFSTYPLSVCNQAGPHGCKVSSVVVTGDLPPYLWSLVSVPLWKARTHLHMVLHYIASSPHAFSKSVTLVHISSLCKLDFGEQHKLVHTELVFIAVSHWLYGNIFEKYATFYVCVCVNKWCIWFLMYLAFVWWW